MVASVLVPVTANVPVVVLLVVVRLVMNAVTAFKSVAKKLELVALVLERLVIVPLVPLMFVEVIPVAEAVVKYVCPDTVRLDEDALLRDVCPVTFSVPFEVRVDVAVIFPPVKLLTTAFVVVEFPIIKLVKLAKVATRLEKNPFVEVLFVVTRLVDVALVAFRLAKTSEEIVVVERIVTPAKVLSPTKV